MFNLDRDDQGKIKTKDYDAVKIIYRITREVSRQTKKDHHYTPEYTFAHEFSLHYNEFAQYFPELGRLRELSKATAIVNLIEHERAINQREIELLSMSKHDTQLWPKLKQDFENVTRNNLAEKLDSWRTKFSRVALTEQVENELKELKSKIGPLSFTENSPEIKECTDGWYNDIRREIISKHGYQVWNRQSAQIYRTMIEPKIPDLISSYNTMKFNRVLEDLSNGFQARLPNLANSIVTELVRDFLNGYSWELSNALVNQEESQLDLQLQKVYPLQKPGILLRALNGSVSSVKEIIRVETEEKLEEFYLNIKKKLIKCRRLEKSFVNTGITQTYEEKDLTETCMWVPASIPVSTSIQSATSYTYKCYNVIWC